MTYGRSLRPWQKMVKGPIPISTGAICSMWEPQRCWMPVSPGESPSQTSKGESHARYWSSSSRLYTAMYPMRVPAGTSTESHCVWRNADQLRTSELRSPSKAFVAGYRAAMYE